MGLIPTATHATPPDPNSTQQGQGRHGGSGHHNRTGEFATVLRYHSDRYTADVRTERGRTLTGVGRLRSSPGEVAPLHPGTEVLINYDYGIPIIFGVMSIPASSNEMSESFSVSDTQGFGGEGNNRTQINTQGNYRQAREPQDVMPGDWAQVGEEGNLFATLAGGVNVMKSSVLSQIRTHLINDLVEIFSRNYRHVTDMGEFTILNDEGRINMRFRGASDQRTEAGPDEENWTIKMDLGSEGDFFNFELCTPQGQTLFKFHVDSEGGAEIFGINGVAITGGSRTGGSTVQESTGRRREHTGNDRDVDIAGSDTVQIGTNQTTTVGSDHEVNIGNDYRLQALRDIAIGAGRNVSLVAQGGEGDAALIFDIEGGNWVVDLGSMTNTMSGLHFKTVKGNMTLESTLGGNIDLLTELGNLKSKSSTAKFITGQPNSVVLGGDTLASNLVKFQELQTLLNDLFIKLDTHTHQAGAMVAAGTLPVTGLSGPPAFPIGAPLTGQIMQLKSIVAGVSS